MGKLVVGQLTDGDFTEPSGDSMRSLRDRLGALVRTQAAFATRRACYQLGLRAAPPRKGGPVARNPAEHATLVRQPEIRTEVVRRVTTIATTLRPTTVAGRTKALLVFFDYLAKHQPQMRRLDQIDRTARRSGGPRRRRHRQRGLRRRTSPTWLGAAPPLAGT